MVVRETETMEPRTDRQDSIERDARAFVLRVAPGSSKVTEALADSDLIVGWSEAQGLLQDDLSWEEFREIVHQTYFSGDDHYRRSGHSTGQIWRFIRDMNIDDWVVVPDGSSFYVGRVKGPARHDIDRVSDDTAYRRQVRWLNAKNPVPRKYARASLQSRMKYKSTCVEATDLLEEIREALATIGQTEIPSFDADLRTRLIDQTKTELQSGRLNDYGFEKVVANIIEALGGRDVRIVPRSKDKGVDILANFMIAKTFSFKLGVQAKHYQASPPVEAWVVEQLVNGMDAEGAGIGWVATSGTFAEEAEDRREELAAEKGYQIELVDGDQLAAMIVDSGLERR